MASVDNTVDNTIVDGGKQTFLEMYKNWINKYKYILFFIVTILLTFVAHTQNTFIEIKKIFKIN